jgi:hypothetical protein
MVMQPSVNFHHPSGRKFSPPVSNQACSYEAYIGPIQIKGTRTRQLSVRLRFVLL